MNVFNSFKLLMLSPFRNILELAGWVVVGISVVLLLVASHIDQYQPPQPPDTPAQHK